MFGVLRYIDPYHMYIHDKQKQSCCKSQSSFEFLLYDKACIVCLNNHQTNTNIMKAYRECWNIIYLSLSLHTASFNNYHFWNLANRPNENYEPFLRRENLDTSYWIISLSGSDKIMMINYICNIYLNYCLLSIKHGWQLKLNYLYNISIPICFQYCIDKQNTKNIVTT